MAGEDERLRPAITINRLTEEDAEFTLSGVDSSVANALRRVLMAEVPCLAIDLCNIYENSSVLHDEFIAHRLGLIPLRYRDETRSLRDVLNLSYECDCDYSVSEVCPKCSILLRLRVENPETDPDAEPVSVTSQDLQIDLTPWMDASGDLDAARARCPFEVAHFSHEADARRAPNDVGILLVKLGPGQALMVDCIARVAIGKLHAKYNPTSTVSMRGVPQLSLDRALLEGVPAKEKKAFVKACQPGVLAYHEASDQITVEAPEKANNIDEIRKQGQALARRHGLPGNPVHTSFLPNTFIYTVETSGALSPASIIDAALTTLVLKTRGLQDACTTAMQGMAVAGAAAGPV